MALLMNGAIRSGNSVVVMNKFDPGLFLTLVQKHKISFLHIVPPIVLFLANHPVVDKFDLSSVHTIVSGAAPLDHDLAKKCSDRLGCDIRQGICMRVCWVLNMSMYTTHMHIYIYTHTGYGMTELSPVSHISPGKCVKFGSAGLLVANTEARVVDPEGNDVKQGERGMRVCLYVCVFVGCYLPFAPIHYVYYTMHTHTQGSSGFADLR
jgi:acyl-CoA synthetase (AMP-forming)/AMP-acid ligase II